MFGIMKTDNSTSVESIYVKLVTGDFKKFIGKARFCLR